MKKIKLLLVAVIAVITTALVAVFAGCGGSAAIDGVYYKDGHMNTGNSESYMVELYSDGTYELLYEQYWHLGADLGLTYGRFVKSYGTYEVTESDEEAQTETVHLNAPDRMSLVAFHRQGTLVAVDTSAWPQGDEANGVAPGIKYTLYERAGDEEVWETAEDFIAAYGREYTMQLDKTSGFILSVALPDGVSQIPFASVAPAA